MTFTCKLNSGGVNLLNSGFGCRFSEFLGKYTYISTRRFISNPGALAKYRYRFPKSISKKGLQVNADMMEDAEELNVRNFVINIDFSQLIAPPALQNSRVISLLLEIPGTNLLVCKRFCLLLRQTAACTEFHFICKFCCSASELAQ